MNAEKFAAAQRLNYLENSLNVINENIEKLQSVLSNVKEIQVRTAALLAEQRLVVAAMPGGDE